VTGSIYSDGTYVAANPTLHAEDSEYKFRYIRGLLEGLRFDRDPIRVLDIGGGAGLVAAQVCEWLATKGARVECSAFDLSPEMLAVQRRNNPRIAVATSDFEEIRKTGAYDVALLIDVIEHIPDNGRRADEVDSLSRYIVYNIPTERNLLDRLRNLYMQGRYYAAQTASLGHLHFFSATSAKRFVGAHHRLLRWVFPDFCGHLLDSPHPDYTRQRANRLRRAELVFSRLIYRYLRPIAPYLIQGSLFILAEGRGGRP
jgi:SAM-dependent methyltransferase